MLKKASLSLLASLMLFSITSNVVLAETKTKQAHTLTTKTQVETPIEIKAKNGKILTRSDIVCSKLGLTQTSKNSSFLVFKGQGVTIEARQGFSILVINQKRISIQTPIQSANKNTYIQLEEFQGAMDQVLDVPEYITVQESGAVLHRLDVVAKELNIRSITTDIKSKNAVVDTNDISFLLKEGTGNVIIKTKNKPPVQASIAYAPLIYRHNFYVPLENVQSIINKYSTSSSRTQIAKNAKN